MHYLYFLRQPPPFFGPGQGGIFGIPPFMPPPGGTPGGEFGVPPFMQPPGGASTGTGPPAGPPPSFVPSQTTVQQTTGVFAVNPGAIRPCLFKFVYLWLNDGQQFWAWLVFVGSRSVAGWRWTGFRWVYFGVDITSITSFVCY